MTEGKMLCQMRRKGKTKYSTVIFHPQDIQFWDLTLLIPRYVEMTKDRSKG